MSSPQSVSSRIRKRALARYAAPVVESETAAASAVVISGGHMSPGRVRQSRGNAARSLPARRLPRRHSKVLPRWLLFRGAPLIRAVSSSRECQSLPRVRSPARETRARIAHPPNTGLESIFERAPRSPREYRREARGSRRVRTFPRVESGNGSYVERYGRIVLLITEYAR